MTDSLWIAAHALKVYLREYIIQNNKELWNVMCVSSLKNIQAFFINTVQKMKY